MGHSAAQRAYRERHPDRVKATKRAYAERNSEKVRSLRVEWKAANPERSREIERASYYRRRFGITIEEYEAILEAQGGVCAICGEPPRAKRLAIDHDHETGRIRGLLCQPCNTALGVLEGLLEKARAYLGTGS